MNTHKELNSLFKYYPTELVEAALLPLMAKEYDYCIDEPMHISHVFYAELNHIIQHSLMAYLQNESSNRAKAGNENIKNLIHIIDILQKLVPMAYVFCNYPNHKYTCLTLILDQFSYKNLDEIHDAINFSLLAYPNISCAVFTYATITDLLKQGHFYYTSLCTPAHCLFKAKANFTLTAPNPILLAETTLKAVTSFQYYSRKSIVFFEGAKRYHKKNENAMAMFMLQQACEFIYRSLIIAFNGKAIKSHDLITLRKHAIYILPHVAGLFHPKIKQEIRLLNSLQEAYTKARYDYSYQANNTQTTSLMMASLNLIKGVKEIFSDHLDVLDSSAPASIILEKN